MFEKNKRFLEEKFPASLRSFRDCSTVLLERAPASFQVPLNEDKVVECPLREPVMRDQYESQKRKLPDSEGLFLWGAGEPEEFTRLTELLAGEAPLIYAESDPAVFESVLNEVDFPELDVRMQFGVIFNTSVPDLLLEVSDLLGQFERICNRVTALVHPDFLARSLEPELTHGAWLCEILKSPGFNLSRSELTDSGTKRDYLSPLEEYPYRKLTRVLELFLVSSPGLRSLYFDTRKDSSFDPFPLTISCLASDNWEQLSRTISSIFSKKIPPGTKLQVIDKGATEEIRNNVRKLESDVGFLNYHHLDQAPGVPVDSGVVARRVEGNTLLFVDNNFAHEPRRDNWLDQLLEPLSLKSHLGAVAPWGLTFVDDCGSDWVTKVYLPGLATPVACDAGSCLAINIQALEEVAELGPVGFEKSKVSWLLREAGWVTVAPPVQPVVRPRPVGGVEKDCNLSTESKAAMKISQKSGVKPRRILNLAAGNDTVES